MTRRGYKGIMISKEFYDKINAIREKLGLYHLAQALYEIVRFYEERA